MTLGPLDLSGRKIADAPVIGPPLDLLAARRLAADVDAKRAHGTDVVASYRRAKLDAQRAWRMCSTARRWTSPGNICNAE